MDILLNTLLVPEGGVGPRSSGAGDGGGWRWRTVGAGLLELPANAAAPPFSPSFPPFLVCPSVEAPARAFREVKELVAASAFELLGAWGG